MSEQSPGSFNRKLIAAFVALTSHLIMHQIDVTSAHFAVAFNIPIHNISIYFSKLFSFRCLLIAVGTAAEPLISLIAGDSRKYISIGCFVFVLILRSMYLIFLYLSSHLSYHVYIILSIEALFFGFFHCSVLALAPEHSAAVALAANVSRVFVLLVQFALDLALYRSPLKMIIIQCWICFILTIIAFGLWAYYNIWGDPDQNQSKEQKPNGGKKDFLQTLGSAVSPFMMFFAGSVFKDFLYPGVLPYALLERDKCHAINMIIPIVYMLGPLTLFIFEQTGIFSEWQDHYNGFWILVVPMVIIFFYSFLAIHTRIRSARAIANSRIRVLIITLIVIFCNSYLDPLSFVGVSKFVVGKSGNQNSNGNNQGGAPNQNDGNAGDVGVITFHAILALFMRFVFSKLSVGYNDTRVSLGYHLPRFRPKHRMSKWNTFWYIFKNTFRRGFSDTINDFRMNIQKYL